MISYEFLWNFLAEFVSSSTCTRQAIIKIFSYLRQIYISETQLKSMYNTNVSDFLKISQERSLLEVFLYDSEAASERFLVPSSSITCASCKL